MNRICNCYRDLDARDPRVEPLPAMHAVMDCTLLDACGWPDISADRKLLPDRDIAPERRGGKTKPWRWPDDDGDEVLALEAERAAEQRHRRADTGNGRRR